MSSIKLSQKHGVNPCIAECYICGQSKNEILLTGAAGERMARDMGYDDGQMPMQAVFDIEPCEECQKLGIAFIEMSHEGKGAKPTGRRCLIKEDAVRQLITPPELLQHILKKRAALLTPDTYTMLGLSREDV